MTGSQRDLSLVSWTLYKVLITVSVFSFSSLFLISGGGHGGRVWLTSYLRPAKKKLI
jgi:hypothetical protein